MTVTMRGGTKARKAIAKAWVFSLRQTGNGMAKPNILITKSRKRYCRERRGEGGNEHSIATAMPSLS